MKKLTMIALAACAAGCYSAAPKAKDVSLKGMYANAASETVAIGSAKITKIPDTIESFVAHYSEDTAWLSPSTKTRFLDIYMTGTNCTQTAGNVVDSICKTFADVAGKAAAREPETTSDKPSVDDGGTEATNQGTDGQ